MRHPKLLTGLVAANVVFAFAGDPKPVQAGDDYFECGACYEVDSFGLHAHTDDQDDDPFAFLEHQQTDMNWTHGMQPGGCWGEGGDHGHICCILN